MAFAVGVDFGSTKTTVTLIKWDNGCRPVDERALVAGVIPSVVFLGENRELAIGDHAVKLGATDPHRVIRDFKRRLGDSVPIVADGWSESTESIIAALVRRVVDDVTDQENAAPDIVALAYPAHWGAYKKSLLTRALRSVGLGEVVLVNEPAAAIAGAPAPFSPEVRTVLVYDLGAGSFDATIMTRTAGEEFAVAGVPQGVDWLGGDDFDQAVFSWVRHGAHLTTVDTADPDVLIRMSQLREACTQAKENLSLDTEVTIPVITPGTRTRIRLVRGDFDELIRDAVEDTLDATRRVIGSAGLAVDDIDAIVLAGGSTRIPLVVQLVSAEFGLPIVIDSRPEASVSLGAARLAVDTLLPPEVAPSALPAVHQPDQPAVRSADLGKADGDGGVHWQVPVGVEPQWGHAAATRAVADESDLRGDDVAVRVEPEPVLLPATTGEASHPDSPPRSGRHRHRSRRRLGWRSAGVVGVLAGLVLLGSSLVASQAPESTDSISQFQSGDPVTTTSTVVVTE